MTAARLVTARRLERMARDLSDRDAAVLDTLARVRVATTAQLVALHFAGAATPTAGIRSCQRSLMRLANARLVHALDRRQGGVRAGSSSTVWALGVAGQRLLRRGGPAGGLDRRRPWTPSLVFLAHRLAITQTLVDLTTSSLSGRLLRFEAEPDSWRRYPGPGGGRLSCKPDAYAAVRHDDYDEAWFLEVDRATESPTVIARKASVYLQYLASGREQATAGVFPWVLFLVPDEARRQVLVRTLAKVKAPDPKFFQVVLQSGVARLLLGGES